MSIALSCLAVLLLGAADAVDTEENLTMSQADEPLVNALKALKRHADTGRRLRSDEGDAFTDKHDDTARRVEETNPESFGEHLKELLTSLKHSTD